MGNARIDKVCYKVKIDGFGVWYLVFGVCDYV
jgi:hypothetical protein